MNKIYRVVWSAFQGQVIVASELAKRSKTSSAGTLMAALFLCLSSSAYADGAGGNNSASLGGDGAYGGPGGGGGAGGVGGTGSVRVPAGSDGLASGAGGAGSTGATTLPADPIALGGAGGQPGTSANPTGGNGGNGGDAICASGCSGGFGGGGGGGGGDGFNGGTLSAVIGVATGGNGGNGGSSTLDGGSGGGGGAGAVLSGSGATSTSANITGGLGGNGGDAANAAGAGFGGSGGSGVFSTGVDLSNSNTVTGGAGGMGGTNPSDGTNSRAGGNGGAGVAGSSFALTNLGTIQGGNGGASGTGATGAAAGLSVGGAGVRGSDIQIVNSGSGSIIGGLAGDGITRANAILFTGGVNSLELQAGSTIVGTVGGAGTNTLALGGTTNATFNTALIGSQYQDFSSFVKTGTGTWVLGGSTALVTPWTVVGGTLQIASDGAVGATSGLLTLQNAGVLATTASFTMSRAATVGSGGGVVDVAGGTSLTASGAIGGAGSLTKQNAGTLLLTGTNTYSGGTTISAGTLQLGNGGTTGSILGNVANSGTLAFNRSDDITFSGVISGAGVINQIGVGTTLLTGNSGTFAGATNVTNGTLRVDGSLGSATSTLSVASGGTIAGHGTIGGNVSITDGILAPGASPGTLTIGGTLVLTSASILNYEFGQAGVVGGTLDDLTVVGGNLTLDGTLNVAAPIGGTFGPGLYRVISYGGTLTNNGLELGTLPAGSDAFVQTGFVGQVNLVNISGLTLNYWDGAGPKFDGVINGGNGVWQAAAGNDNWTDAAGDLNAPYMDGSFAIFAGAPGTVSVDNSLGAVNSSGMQFATSGYVVEGDPITLLAGANTIRVGDGTGAGAGYLATIGSALTGTGGVDKTDLGTLVLTGANTYAGGTTISAGTLQLGNGGTTGSIVGDVIDNGTLAFNRSDAVTFGGAISGTGAVHQIGSGTTTLTAANTYTGGTTISAGTLQLGDGVTSGSIVGDVVDNGTLAFNNPADTVFAGAISGTGGVTKSGAAVQTLTGNNSYTGGTTINAGTLQIGDGGTTGSIVGNVTNNGTLAFNRSNAMAYGGVISGAGSVMQAGAGTTTLTGTGSSVGSVNVNAGTLDLAQAGTFTAGAYTTASGATTHIAADSTLTVSGAFTQAGGSTLNVDLGSTQPIISAATANLGGTLGITGFGTSVPNTASARIGTPFNVIRTTGGITNDFSAVDLGGAGSEFDFLTLAGSKSADGLNYNVGFGLTWLAGSTLGNGVFTLESPTQVFDVDVPLGNQAPSSTGWDGKTLTKNGAGTLVLSAANTYTGATLVNAGTLQTGVANAFASSSAVSVAGGATLALNGFDQLAHNLGGAGNLTLGSAALTVQSDSDTTFGGAISGTGSLTKAGAAALMLTGDNTYTGGTTINGGTLQIGDGGTAGSIAGSITNNAALVINRSGTVDLPGSISGSGSLAKLGTGVASLSGANTYSGATDVKAGMLKAGAANAFSPASAHSVATGATLDTGGFSQTIAALDNAGTVSLLSATPGSTLTVTGAYVGRGGTLRLGARLGDSASPSDRLVLDGPAASASGTTNLEIANVAGLGALTSGNGIEVVSARNGATTTAQTTKDAFMLAGGATIAGVAKGNATLQAPHIDAGAFEYRLYAADADGSGENWYLRSTSAIGITPPPGPVPDITPPPIAVPTFRAEVPMIAGLPAQFRQGDLAMLGNLHRRIGDEDSSQQQKSSDASIASRDRRAWGRAIYTDLDIRQEGTVNPQSNGYLGGLQAGTDLWSDSAWRAGVYVGYLEGGSDAAGNARGTFGRVGRNDLQSRYLGGYATWTRGDGLYADTVLQGGSHRYTLHPDFNPSVSGKATSLTASVEVGKPFRLSDDWSIEPQAQLAYQRSSFDDVQLSGATVVQNTDAGWIGRLGVRIKGDIATSAGRLQPYGRANLYYGSSGTDVARFISPGTVTDISSRSGYTSAELAAGMTLALNGKTSVYGELGRVFNVSGDARVRSSVQGSVGLRVSWN